MTDDIYGMQMSHELNPLRQAPGINMPLGRFDVIPSGVTGRPLHYFTPEPLPILLERSLAECSGEMQERNNPALTLLLARSAATDHAGNVDVVQAKRIAQVAFGHVLWTDLESILKLGSDISPAAKKLRQEIVFSGAASASASGHVYPPHEAVPALLESLADGLKFPPIGMDATVFSAVVGFFCVHVHPFIDGNGRWARALSVQAGTLMKGSDSGTISAIFQNKFKHLLANSIWPTARRTGLKEYLQTAKSFEAVLRNGIDTRALELSNLSLSALKRHFNSRREYEEAAIVMLLSSGADYHLQKERFNLSEKRQRWLAEELDGIAKMLSPATSSQYLFRFVADAAGMAVERAENYVKRSFK